MDSEQGGGEGWDNVDRFVEIAGGGWDEIRPVQRAYLIALVKYGGHRGKAAAAAGVAYTTTYRWWKGFSKDQEPDPVYVELYEAAIELAGDVLEDEAIRRAVHGLPRYQTNAGKPVEHPDDCECGHHRTSHARPRGGQTERPCTECTCADFRGVPLVEREYSDSLLKTLLAGARPEKYTTRRVEISGTIRNLNWDALPDHIIARLAAGEHPLSVLASAAEEGHGKLLESGAELHGPGASDGRGERESEAGEREAAEREAGADS